MLEHLPIFRCPVTGDPLREMTPDEIEDLNNHISRGELTFQNGEIVKKTLDSGLVSSNDGFAYTIEEGIVILLKDLAIALQKERFPADNREEMLKKEKRAVQDFYDKIG
jgi:uncharacterized protein YbaR (Trm112 family)